MVQSNMSEQDSSSEKHGPMWDHDDLSMATWVEDRLRWCVKKDPNYASLASEGFILDRSRVVVPTQFHGVALREGWLVEASVEDVTSAVQGARDISGQISGAGIAGVCPAM